MFKALLLRYLLVLSLLCSSRLSAAVYQTEDQPIALQRLSFLSQKGVLKEKSNGYLYLDLPNDYITQAIALIETSGKMLPSRDYTNRKGIGAHISVIFENERWNSQIYEVLEVGQEFSFSIKEFGTLSAKNDKNKIWMLIVDAPDLEALRERYGLNRIARDQDFHITIGLELGQ